MMVGEEKMKCRRREEKMVCRRREEKMMCRRRFRIRVPLIRIRNAKYFHAFYVYYGIPALGFGILWAILPPPPHTHTHSTHAMWGGGKREG